MEHDECLNVGASVGAAVELPPWRVVVLLVNPGGNGRIPPASSIAVSSLIFIS